MKRFVALLIALASGISGCAVDTSQEEEEIGIAAEEAALVADSGPGTLKVGLFYAGPTGHRATEMSLGSMTLHGDAKRSADISMNVSCNATGGDCNAKRMSGTFALKRNASTGKRFIVLSVDSPAGQAGAQFKYGYEVISNTSQRYEVRFRPIVFPAFPKFEMLGVLGE